MKKVAILLIKIYQKTLSPSTGFFKFVYSLPIFSLGAGMYIGCRQEPSCSQYCIQVVSKYGVRKGLALTTKRVIMCR